MFFGGIENKKHAPKKSHPGAGTTSNVSVDGINDQDTGNVNAEVTSSMGMDSLQGFVHKHTEDSATVYTDDHKA